ncbi:MAG: bifunctional phosphoribosylaminoimidazolecarboxamide formyltransferase/IMP cyclohydrolase [Chloroflexota bacterium]|nr:bifunctional phosphoribosylaminoimidazolecarboxamide formyltransferase/IMP cyclohydrolase [Chloroflexota bacterium]
MPAGRRALLSVSDKSGLGELARGLADLGFELVSTGGTANALRSAGLDVTDVASVTGFPEMLDGRVKTLHPRIHAGVLADLRRGDHRVQLAAAWIEPFELVVVNLYPFAAAAARPETTPEELVEEIDIGGPTLIRAAAKNHASVAIVTHPGEYRSVLRELAEGGGVSEPTRRRLALEAFRHTAEYDARIAATLPPRLGIVDGADAPFPPRLDLGLELVQRLRYGENPHQRAALYTLATPAPGAGPFAQGVELLQGKELSYNNVLDASAAVALTRDLRGPACVVVKHSNPCGAAEAADLVAAWEKALAGDPVSAFGAVVAVTRPIDAPLAERLASIFLEVVVAPAVEPEARQILASRTNLRLLVDPYLHDALRPTDAHPPIEYRSAGGAVLAAEADVVPDDPGRWTTVTRREPTERERVDLDLAWRVVRHVKSNAIVLVRAGAVVGVGAGQMSRVDSARLAVAKAGPERAAGAVCASDAFYPFPDGVVACTDAGASAFVQPGGSVRDAEVIAAADAAGAAMVFTGTRHFRH